MRKFVMSIVLGTLLSVAAFFAYIIHVKRSAAEQINATLTAQYYKDRLNEFAAQKVDTNSVVFIGDSHMECFNLTVFNNPALLNQGLAGDFTEGLANRIDNVLKFHPHKMVIQIGINDLSWRVSLQTMLSNYDTILNKISTLSPRTIVYVNSVFPTNLHKGMFSHLSVINKKIVDFNNMLKELCEKYHATYIDVWSKFVPSGEITMIPLYTVDGIHLTAEGYSLWAELIKNQVN
jgi:lysophospholipase L1-like esterase